MILKTLPVHCTYQHIICQFCFSNEEILTYFKSSVGESKIALKRMVIMLWLPSKGNGHADTSSNPTLGSLHFI